MKKDTNIVIDNKIRFGKPTIKGTRIAVDEVMGWLAAGMDFAEIEEEYGLMREQIVDAVRYVEGWVHDENITNYAVPA